MDLNFQLNIYFIVMRANQWAKGILDAVNGNVRVMGNMRAQGFRNFSEIILKPRVP